jgi:hypothetical protein
MQRRRTLVAPVLAGTIERTIRTARVADFASLCTAGGSSRDSQLVIKYIPLKYCRGFRPDIVGSNPQLRISDSPGFTWGTGNYVAPLAYPLSTAIYGRAGVVAKLDRAKTQVWRIFDARVPTNQDLYVQWTVSQPAFRWLTLTCHANLANQFLRNAFREAFLIDCVLFHPDQRNADYTKIADTWMCVSDWTSNKRLARRESAVLENPRLAILVSEEFAPIGADVRRRSLIGPRGPLPTNALLAAAVRQAYTGSNVMELTS